MGVYGVGLQYGSMFNWNALLALNNTGELNKKFRIYSAIFWLFVILVGWYLSFVQPFREGGWSFSQFLHWPLTLFLSYWVVGQVTPVIFSVGKAKTWPTRVVFYISIAGIAVVLQYGLWLVLSVLLNRLFVYNGSLGMDAIWLNWQQQINLMPLGGIAFGVGMLLYHLLERQNQLEYDYGNKVHLEKKLSDARFYALQMQLNPHFLFNAFNSIATMIRKGEGKKAIAMLAGLGDMLRVALQQNKQVFSTIDKEMQMLESYLAIESIRFRDRLVVEIAVDPQLGHAKIPAFILQPIVENAFKHGISKCLGMATLRVSIEEKQKKIEINVTNSVPEQGWDLTHDKGIGMNNVTSRLLLLYQNAFQLLITQLEGTVNIKLVLPFEHEKN